MTWKPSGHFHFQTHRHVKQVVNQLDIPQRVLQFKKHHSHPIHGWQIKWLRMHMICSWINTLYKHTPVQSLRCCVHTLACKCVHAKVKLCGEAANSLHILQQCFPPFPLQLRHVVRQMHGFIRAGLITSKQSAPVGLTRAHKHKHTPICLISRAAHGYNYRNPTECKCEWVTSYWPTAAAAAASQRQHQTASWDFYSLQI